MPTDDCQDILISIPEIQCITSCLRVDSICVRFDHCVIDWVQVLKRNVILIKVYSLLAQHYSDVIMSAMASQITSVSIVYSAVCLGADQRKHQSSASLAFVRGIHRWPVNSPRKGPVMRKMFPFDDIIMSLTTSVAASTDNFDRFATFLYQWGESSRVEKVTIMIWHNSFVIDDDIISICLNLVPCWWFVKCVWVCVFRIHF